MAEPELSLQVLRLAALPEFDPPPQLWTRIAAEHDRRRRRRLLHRWAAALAASLVLLGSVAMLAPPAPAPAGPLTALEQRSQELEQVYAGLAASSSPLEHEAELRAVEAALQQAYDRGADDDELAPLWQQRNEVLAGLIALAADGAQLTRI